MKKRNGQGESDKKVDGWWVAKDIKAMRVFGELKLDEGSL